MAFIERSVPFGLGQFISTMKISQPRPDSLVRIDRDGDYNRRWRRVPGLHLPKQEERTDQPSYRDILSQAEKVRQEIQNQPYCLPLYILLAQFYSCLAYPDLATGAAYKALLLSDAVQNEGDEYHELAVHSLSDLMSSLASDEERQAFYAGSTISLSQDDAEDIPYRLQSILTQIYLPLMWVTQCFIQRLSSRLLTEPQLPGSHRQPTCVWLLS